MAVGGGGKLCLCMVVGLGKFFSFFFLGCGFRVIVGGGGVGSIPYDLGCINGVESSLHFFRVLC